MYSPPRYAPRSDWYQVLGNGPPVDTWRSDLFNYWQWVSTQNYTLERAWIRARMTSEKAKKALISRPPTPTNEAGLIPPDLASRVYARSVARTMDPYDDFPDLVLDPPSNPVVGNESPAFTAPRYAARTDWRQKLESMAPPQGSWQADLVTYWRLRSGGRSEEDAWAGTAMSPDNAVQALMRERPSPANDSGLIPDEIVGRVLACSVSRTIYAIDEFPVALQDPLEPTG